MSASVTSLSHTLILGGARSGKSRFAERLARQSGREVCYIATATAQDAEMQARILRHQAERPTHWLTHEEPLALAAALQATASPTRVLVVDCLTLWLTNLLCLEQPQRLEQEVKALYACLAHLACPVILVSNEVGMGIVPLGALSRQYVDEAGRLHQQLALQLDNVLFIIAGLPQILKGCVPWNG